MARDPFELSFFDRRHQDPEKLQSALVDRVWGLPSSVAPKCASLYLQHYNALATAIDVNAISPDTHNDAIELVNFVKDRKNDSLQCIKMQLLNKQAIWLKSNTESAVRKAIDFAVPLWLMVPTHSWNDNESLCTFVKRLFPSSASTSLVDEEICFNARSLCKIGGFDIVWTSQLNEHLRLNPRSLELYVFRHGTLLGGRQDPELEDIYPEGLLKETAETLSLLFPFGESRYKGWNRRMQRKADPDIEIGLACFTSRNLNHYNFWYERLKQIQLAYDNSSPKSLGQWVHDRRDSNRYYTFWFAVAAILLTLLFGLIQSITGILQITLPK